MYFCFSDGEVLRSPDYVRVVVYTNTSLQIAWFYQSTPVGIQRFEVTTNASQQVYMVDRTSRFDPRRLTLVAASLEMNVKKI